jgi:hypothetical protein
MPTTKNKHGVTIGELSRTYRFFEECTFGTSGYGTLNAMNDVTPEDVARWKAKITKYTDVDICCVPVDMLTSVEWLKDQLTKDGRMTDKQEQRIMKEVFNMSTRDMWWSVQLTAKMISRAKVVDEELVRCLPVKAAKGTLDEGVLWEKREALLSRDHIITT